MRKRNSGLVLLLLISLVLTACGSTTPTTTTGTNASPAVTAQNSGGAMTASGKPLATIPTGQTVTIKYASYNYGTPGLGGKGTQMLIDEFQAANPNIKVEARNVPAGDILKTVVAESAAGDPPDIAQLVLNGLDYVVNNTPAVPLNDIAPKEEFEQLKKDILPQAWKLGEYNGKVYGSPYTFSTPTLFYNADIFKAAGLDPEKPPTTWDEVRKYGQQIKDKTGKSAIVINALPDSFDWIVQSLINSNGGSTLSTDRKKATFNEPAAVEAIKMWQDLVKDGIHPKLSQPDASAAMSAGNLGMYMTSSVLLPSLSEAAKGKFDLRTTGEPSFGTKVVRPVNSGSALFVFSKDPVKQRATWEFLKFVASKRGYTIITGLIGYVPQRLDIVEDPNFLKPYLDKDPRMLPTIKQLNNLEPWVSWPGKDSVQAVKLFMQATYDTVYDGQEVQKTMDDVAKRVTDLINQK